MEAFCPFNSERLQDKSLTSKQALFILNLTALRFACIHHEAESLKEHKTIQQRTKQPS